MEGNGGLKRSPPRTLLTQIGKRVRRGGSGAQPDTGGLCRVTRARTPTPSLRTLQRPQPRPEMDGKDGSVPGRRGHHVQLPANPSPPRGPPRPGLVAGRGKPRRLSTEGKASCHREPTSTPLAGTLLGTAKPGLCKEETKATLKGSRDRNARRRARLGALP